MRHWLSSEWTVALVIVFVLIVCAAGARNCDAFVRTHEEQAP